MAFSPFKIGDIVDNKKLTEAYKVGNTGGMRRSKAHNCLVVISDHSKTLYEDKWHDGVLHYTGMGKTGDQDIDFAQNRTLNESRSNGVAVHLFEVMDAKEYTFRGEVELVGQPYQEEQPDQDGNMRKVWMFPLKPISGVPVMSGKKFQAKEASKEARAKSRTRKMSDSELKEAAKRHSSKKPGDRVVQSSVYERDPVVAEYAKRRAKGKCQLCGKDAPFKDKNGEPYLESHHIIWLSDGGEDTVENTVALCPNCHRRMHVVKDSKDVAALQAVNASSI